MLVTSTRPVSAASIHLALLLLATLPLAPFSASYAETRYISDELKVAVRTGASNQHRIIKFLDSGTAVKILGQDESGDYSHVEMSNGKDGWILNSQLMKSRSGRDLLVSANKKLEKTKEENRQLGQTIRELKSQVQTLESEKTGLQDDRNRLTNSLEDIKVTAANPLALSRKNSQLEQELDQARATVDMLEQDNQRLKNNVMQEWFIIGSAVSIGSLVLGIILTRIRWRKRDSWSDGF